MAENYDTILADMVAVAREAGALTLAHFKRFRDLEIGIKGPADFVSDADRESEQLIRKYLFSRYPDWSFTGEEFPPVDGADREHRWLVDPIDGTTNFINGQHYTISIALRRGNQTVCGALYNPVADEMFSAERGHGAHLNGTRLPLRAPATELRRALAGVEMKRIDRELAGRLASWPPYASQRNFGASTLDWCYTAAGRFDIYVHGGQKLWDYAAGALILEEAGGRLASLSGSFDIANVWERSVVASASPELFELWRDWLKAAGA